MNMKKILKGLFVGGLILSLMKSNLVNANDILVDQVNDPSPRALSDSVFSESSRPLERAIIEKYDGSSSTYPKVDLDADGYISAAEASSWTGETIALNGMSLSGTIDGIEYFAASALKQLNLSENGFHGGIDSVMLIDNLTFIHLGNNQFSGTIPSTINNLSDLKVLILAQNEFAGSIPMELYSMGSLETLNLHSNQLSGEISSDVINLVNLKTFSVGRNNLSGSVPSELGQLVNLISIGIDHNEFTGELPDSIYDLPLLNILDASSNKELTGNVAEGFKDHPNISTVYVDGTNMIQAMPEAPSLTVPNFRYDDLAEDLFNDDGSLREDVGQAEIDKAQESADWWSEPTKSEWQANIDNAQVQLEERIELENQNKAREAVDALFGDETKTSIKDTTDQSAIDHAQVLIDKVTNETVKKALQEDLDLAKKLLDERNFVVLRNFDIFKGKGAVSAQIDAPVEKFTKLYVNGVELDASKYTVSSGSTVITLSEAYLKTLVNATYTVHAEYASGAKVALPLSVDVASDSSVKPNQQGPSEGKPSITGGTTRSGTGVRTGDTTNLALLYGMLGVSLLGAAFIIKRRKKQI